MLFVRAAPIFLIIRRFVWTTLPPCGSLHPTTRGKIGSEPEVTLQVCTRSVRRRCCAWWQARLSSPPPRSRPMSHRQSCSTISRPRHSCLHKALSGIAMLQPRGGEPLGEEVYFIGPTLVELSSVYVLLAKPRSESHKVATGFQHSGRALGRHRGRAFGPRPISLPHFDNEIICHSIAGQRRLRLAVARHHPRNHLPACSNLVHLRRWPLTPSGTSPACNSTTGGQNSPGTRSADRDRVISDVPLRQIPGDVDVFFGGPRPCERRRLAWSSPPGKRPILLPTRRAVYLPRQPLWDDDIARAFTAAVPWESGGNLKALTSFIIAFGI